MSIENTPDGGVTDNLDDFSAELFGHKPVEPEAATSEEVEEAEDSETDANEQDTRPEDDTLEAEETEEEAPVEKPKLTRSQKRIEELVAKNHETERKLLAALEREEALKNKETKPEPVKVAETTEPQADDLNEDGTEKYPLGEFDPKFIRDLAKYAIKAEREAAAEEEAKTAQEKEAKAVQDAIQANWTEKLGPAKERYPDFSEKGEELFDTFADLDQAYGEYLVTTLMAMDFGPDVLYHLANNVDEANKIVKLGPTKAAIALGRLEAKFSDVEEEPQTRQKITKAPPPPTAINKGTSVARADVPDDTDDLDAFSAKLFKKRR